MVAAALSALVLAAPFGEAPLLTLGNHYDGSCLHATGAPGEVAVSLENGVRFLRAGPNGFTRTGDVPVTDSFCPSAAVSPNGTGVVAMMAGDDPRRIFAALRAPGGAWGEAVPIADLSGDDSDISVAVADSGDAVVAWSESTDTTHRWRVARRPAGAAAFGPAEAIGGDRPRDGGIWAGVDNAGETFVVTAAIESAQPPFHVPVRVAIAPRGGAFGAPAELGALPWRSTPALAVAPDGRAVAAFPDGASLRVAERAPGEGFGAAAPVAPASDAVGVDVMAQLAASGAGAVAWTGGAQGGAGIVTRAAPGTWSAPVAIAAKAPFGQDPLLASETWTALPGTNGYFAAHPERLRLTAGAAALARRIGDRVALSTVALGAAAADTQVAGHELGTPYEVAPLALADGTPALAWSESLGDYARLDLHLAASGLGAPADPRAPTVRVGKAKNLVLPISCSAACWVRARVVGYGNQGFFSLTKAGHGRLKVEAGGLPAGPVRIRVLHSAPKALVPRGRIVKARVAGGGPAIHVVGLRARRDGADVAVTWRVQRPEKDEAFAVTGTATRSQAGEPLALGYTVSSHAKRSFLVTLRDVPDARFVALRTYGGVRLIVPVS